MTVVRDDGYIYLADYAPPTWRIERAELVFELDSEHTEVEARLHLTPTTTPAAPLLLDGEDLVLLTIAVNGTPLTAEAYHYDGRCLRIEGVDTACVVHTRVRIAPSRNTRLEGLYTSGQLLLTQCEAEGFRRITFFTDRPDVMPLWNITLRADRSRYPVLLANGNPVATRLLDAGRHEAVWHNPHPTPSYLFAIAAGVMDKVSKSVVTQEGNTVELAVWAEPGDVGRCAYALDAVERSLRWDEQRFGRAYDLAVFNIVAAQDFTMGAMENKGLNIFNARYILADEASATDADFLAVESVIAHEYLHNWSGNRVTCRDWFQLSLKEGLTVFRDQEFSADLHSRPLQRIETVRMLRARQFPEDSGALAHPVRPLRFREISNFYTATVYEKGAEVVRLLHTLLGERDFRAGMDRYFSDNDGRAATIEDFLAAHAAASGRDLEQFARWYAYAGTPEVHIEDDFDVTSGDYTLRIRQHLPATVAADEAPLLIPLRFALYDAEGRLLDRLPESDAVMRGPLIELNQREHRLHFPRLGQRPLPAFNQGFTAPIRVRYHYTAENLARLATFEREPVARWDLLQQLASAGLLGQLDPALSATALSTALGELLCDDAADPAFVAECLQLPDFESLAEQATALDIDALLQTREALLQRLANEHAHSLRRRYDALAEAAAGGLEAPAMAARALRNACLKLLSRTDPSGALASAQFHASQRLTDRLAALSCLIHFNAPEADAAQQHFLAHCADDPLLIDKWLGLRATRPHPDSLETVAQLLRSTWWKPTNPNRVRAILGNFARNNPHGFHRADGAGYRLLLEQVQALDAINPQVAARMLGALEAWQRYDAPRRKHVATALEKLREHPLSPDCRDLLARLLA